MRSNLLSSFVVAGGLALGLSPQVAAAQAGPDAKTLNDGWQLRFVVNNGVPVCTMVKLSANGGVFGFSGGMDGTKPIVKGIALLPTWETPAGKATTVTLSFGAGTTPVTVPGEMDEHMVTFDPPLDSRMDPMDTATSIHVTFETYAGDFDITGGKAASTEWETCVTNKGIK